MISTAAARVAGPETQGTGAVEAIDCDINPSKPRRKHAKYLDTRSGRVRLARAMWTTIVYHYGGVNP
ncbi:MAG: hypothetical protein M3Z96_05200 [Pseudomonadota bacterium]|nr:hypothetical protein [Pseudomonadota bacterium]